jgi:anti-sigma factor RsiW
MKPEDELQLHAYVDGELSAAEAMQLERRIAADAEMSASLAELRAMRQRLREQASYHAAPEALGARIRAQGYRAAGAGFRPGPLWTLWRGWSLPRFGLWASGVVAGALMALVIPALHPGLADFGARFGPNDGPQFGEMLDGHLRAALDTHWVDVASSDRHTVKPFLSAHLGFSPNVPDLTDLGYELLGGRLDVLGAQPVATLVYRRRQHMISVYVWPEKHGAVDEKPVVDGERRGYHLVRWQVSGMAYRSVSDLNAQELEDFSRLLSAAQ